MDYEQLYNSESDFRSVSNRNTFDQFNDRNQSTPSALNGESYPDHTVSKSSFCTFNSEQKKQLKGEKDWIGSVEACKFVPNKKNEPLSLNEQMRKFSNRYLFETVKCNRYDLMGDYFNKEKPISDLLKTPQTLNRPSKKKEISMNSRKILVQHPHILRVKNSFNPTNDVKNNNCAQKLFTIDGSLWQPKLAIDRSECGWYRKHRVSTLQTEKSHKAINSNQSAKKPKALDLTCRETNSFFKPPIY